jgi:dTDP-4-dehydrorhamnose reductase
MNILTLGNGFIANHLPYSKILDRIEPNQYKIKRMLNLYKPDVLINTIGFCGIKNIDDCEFQKEKTSITNTIIPTLLAIECEKLGIQFIQIGSGCIFFPEERSYNPHPWTEKSIPNPLSYYSKSKYATDLAIQDLKTSLILRIRMPLSEKNNSRNLINKLIKYDKIIDIPNSVTFLKDFTKFVDFAANKNLTGIYNVTNPGSLSAKDIMDEYRKYKPKHRFSIISGEELDKLTSAKRSNCLLNTEKINIAGFEMQDAKQALVECMKNYCANLDH